MLIIFLYTYLIIWTIDLFSLLFSKFKGALIDEIQSFKKKKEWLVSRLSQRGEEIRRNLGLIDTMGQTLYHVNKINVNRYQKTKKEIKI